MQETDFDLRIIIDAVFLNISFRYCSIFDCSVILHLSHAIFSRSEQCAFAQIGKRLGIMGTLEKCQKMRDK